MSSAVVKLHHPESNREKLYVKARQAPDGNDILWAHFDVKLDSGRYKRIWIDDIEERGVFDKALSKRGYDPGEVRLSISEWLDREANGERGIL